MPNKLSDAAVSIIREATVEAAAVRLNCGILSDRKLYEEVDECLVRMNGKWNGSKKKHLFPYDPAEAISAVLETGTMPEKNPNDYFPTPPEVVDDIFSNPKVEDAIQYCSRNGLRALEPSAGQGAIARRLVDAGMPKELIDCVESNFINAAALRRQGFNVVEVDFMEFRPDRKYDLVVMNPPFSFKGNKRLYADHIQHAAELLSDDGVLASVAPSTLLTSDDTKNNAVCDLVAMHRGVAWENGSGAFKQAGTSVNTVSFAYRNEDAGLLDQEASGHSNHNIFAVTLHVNNTCEPCERRAALVRRFSEAEDPAELAELAQSVRGFYRKVVLDERQTGHMIYLRDKDYGLLSDQVRAEAAELAEEEGRPVPKALLDAVPAPARKPERTESDEALVARISGTVRNVMLPLPPVVPDESETKALDSAGTLFQGEFGF